MNDGCERSPADACPGARIGAQVSHRVIHCLRIDIGDGSKPFMTNDKYG